MSSQQGVGKRQKEKMLFQSCVQQSRVVERMTHTNQEAFFHFFNGSHSFHAQVKKSSLKCSTRRCNDDDGEGRRRRHRFIYQDCFKNI